MKFGSTVLDIPRYLKCIILLIELGKTAIPDSTKYNSRTPVKSIKISPNILPIETSDPNFRELSFEIHGVVPCMGVSDKC